MDVEVWVFLQALARTAPVRPPPIMAIVRGGLGDIAGLEGSEGVCVELELE